MQQKTIIVKLTGNLIEQTDHGLDATYLEALAAQVKQLSETITFGIVMGGGNFFRGAVQSKEVHISEQTGHTVGMLATMMNGLILQDIFEQAGINTTLFSALPCETVGLPLSPQGLRSALRQKRCLIFSGGTGNPFFSTDTTAVVRALQIGATEIWKGTKVDGIYTDDPKKNPQAQMIKRLSYKEALEKNLHIMDAAAFALAEPHNLVLRVFNIFTDNALIKAATDTEFGSTVGHI